MKRNLIKLFTGLIICFSFINSCKTGYQKVYGRSEFLENKFLLKELPNYEVRIKTPDRRYYFNKTDNDTSFLLGYLTDTSTLEDEYKNKFLQIYTDEVFPDSIIGFKKVQLNPEKINSAYESGMVTDTESNFWLELSMLAIGLLVLLLILSAQLDKAVSNFSCYIASLVYGDPFAPEVILLRAYRDKVLKQYFAGRMFIVLYYSIAPRLIPVLKRLPFIQKIIRLILDRFIIVLRRRKIATGNL